MTDMHDSGRNAFRSWAAQERAPNGKVFYNRWLGPFNPDMPAREANKRLDHVGKLSEHGQMAFQRGWSQEQALYRQAHG